MRSLAVVALLTVVSANAYAETIYEWHDAQGQRHLSDLPPRSDQKSVKTLDVDPRGVNAVSSAPLPRVEPPTPAPKDESVITAAKMERNCKRMYGKPCDEVHNWQRYARTECALRRDTNCHDYAYFEKNYRPRPLEIRRQKLPDSP